MQDAWRTLPDVRAPVGYTHEPRVPGTWFSRATTWLADRVAGCVTSRRLFKLDAADNSTESQEASLTHRTISARLRFVDFSHSCESAKRPRGRSPERFTVTRSAKDVRRVMNLCGGASRFVYNQALAFIHRQPTQEQAALYKAAVLYPILIARTTYKTRTAPALGQHETSDAYTKRLERNAARLERLSSNKERYMGENLLDKHTWLKQVPAAVMLTALRSLQFAYAAGVAKQWAVRKTGKRAKSFRLHFKKRSQPSAWTFTLPAQLIRAEHIPRPGGGKAVLGQPLPQPRPSTWTRLSLPTVMGGSGDAHNGRAAFPGVVLITQKVDLDGNGRLLADAKFSRDRFGRWSVHCQRAALKPPRSRPLEQRLVAFNDPGVRTALTVYTPDGRRRKPGSPSVEQGCKAEVVEYMAGNGGASHLFQLCKRVDALVSKAPARDEWPALSRNEYREAMDCKKQEHRLRAKVRNKVRDAHIRISADIWSRCDTFVDPVFDSHNMAKRPLAPDDPRRKLCSKSVRQMFSLCHGALRQRLRHSACTMGKEYCNASEEYTTVTCPRCLRARASFTGTSFECPSCCYTAPRDMKSGLTLAIKCLRPGWGLAP